jgi:hypothetical protein
VKVISIEQNLTIQRIVADEIAMQNFLLTMIELNCESAFPHQKLKLKACVDGHAVQNRNKKKRAQIRKTQERERERELIDIRTKMEEELED